MCAGTVYKLCLDVQITILIVITMVVRIVTVVPGNGLFFFLCRKTVHSNRASHICPPLRKQQTPKFCTPDPNDFQRQVSHGLNRENHRLMWTSGHWGFVYKNKDGRRCLLPLLLLALFKNTIELRSLQMHVIQDIERAVTCSR